MAACAHHSRDRADGGSGVAEMSGDVIGDRVVGRWQTMDADGNVLCSGPLTDKVTPAADMDFHIGALSASDITVGTIDAASIPDVGWPFVWLHDERIRTRLLYAVSAMVSRLALAIRGKRG